MKRGYAPGGASSQATKRGRRPLDYKTRVVQGDVTINLDINDQEPQIRQKWMHSNDKNSRVGDFYDKSQVQIHRDDLVFVVRRDTKLARSKLPFDYRNSGIVSFNAFPTAGARTIDEFQRFFKFVGVSKLAFNHGQLDQPLNGISVQHRGATTVRNDGLDTFMPGDKMAATVPSPDAAQRNATLAQTPKFEGIEQTRLHAIPRRVTYTEATRIPERVIPYMIRGPAFTGSFDDSTSLWLLRPDSGISIPQLSEFMLSLKQVALQFAFNSVAVLSAYGLVTLNTPQYGTGAAAKSLDASLLNQPLTRILGRGESAPQVTVDATTKRATAQFVADNAADRASRKQQLLWLARKLDLVHDSTRDKANSLESSRHLIEGLLGVDYAHFMNKDANQRRFDVRRLLDRAVNPDSLGAVRVKGQRRRYAEDTFELQLASRQQRAPVDFYESAIQAKLSVDEQVSATILNFSRPDEPLDVLM